MSFAVILMLICMVATLVVLIIGLGAMAVGGKFNERYSNKLMTARVALQAATLLMLAIVIFTK